jgi:hypothetical protein
VDGYRDSVIGKGTGYRLERRGIVLDFSLQGQEIFLSTEESRQAPLWWVMGSFSRRIRWSEREPIELPSNVKVKNEWSYNFTPLLCLNGVQRHL